MSKGKFLPVLIAVFVLALTPVLAYADAGPKHKLSAEDAQTLVDKALDIADDEDVDISSHGSFVSWVAKSLKDSSSDLMGALTGLGFWDDYDNLKHGQIVSAIAKSDVGKDASEDDGDSDDDSNDDSNSEDDEETGKKNNGKALGKIKNADKHDDDVNSEDDDSDDEDDEEDDEEDEDDDSDEKTRGKSEENKHKGQGAKK